MNFFQVSLLPRVRTCVYIPKPDKKESLSGNNNGYNSDHHILCYITNLQKGVEEIDLKPLEQLFDPSPVSGSRRQA